MKYKWLIASMSCLAISSCAAGTENGLLYPHTNSMYLATKKPTEYSMEVKKKYQSSSVAVNLSDIGEKSAKLSTQAHLVRERVFIDANYYKVWQALLKFSELYNYHIKKADPKEGFLEVDIASNVAQYYSTYLPKEISMYTNEQHSVHGIVAWNFYMVIFASNANNKTLLEFIPKYYIITSKTQNAEYMLKSNGYFEKKCVDFVKKEVESY